MKFTGVVLIVITILFAVGLRLAETGEEKAKLTPEPSLEYEPRIIFTDDQGACPIIMVERVGERPSKVTIDLECYGRHKEDM